MTPDDLAQIRDAWANSSEQFNKKTRAWTGKDSEVYRVLTAIIDDELVIR